MSSVERLLRSKCPSGIGSFTSGKSRKTRPLETVVLGRRMHFEEWRRHPEVIKRSGQHDMGIVAHLSSEYRGKTDLILELPASKIKLVLGLRDGYEKNRYWHDGENELSDLLYPSQDPQTLLDWYPCPIPKRWRYLDCIIYGYARRGNQSRLIESFESRVSPQKNWACVESVQSNVHMSLALRMLDASEVYITRLELFRYREVLRDVQFSVLPLKKLQELVLDLPYRIDYSEVFDYRGRWELPIWLRGADDLQTLIISSQRRR